MVLAVCDDLVGRMQTGSVVCFTFLSFWLGLSYLSSHHNQDCWKEKGHGHRIEALRVPKGFALNVASRFLKASLYYPQL